MSINSAPAPRSPLALLPLLVEEHFNFGYLSDSAEEIIACALQGNGPAQYIVANWWRELDFESEAAFWFEQPACREHVALIARLQRENNPSCRSSVAHCDSATQTEQAEEQFT